MDNKQSFVAEAKDGGWRMLVAGLIGMALGISAMPFYTLGIFTDAIAQDLGWTRTMVQSGLSAQMIGTILVVGMVGWAIDKFGVRSVALYSQAGLGLAFVLLANQSGSLLMWQISWLFLAFLGVGTSPMTWSRGIVDWFEKGRGFALGIALSGSGLTAFAGPPLVDAVISAYGWRAGYLAMAGMMFVVALPITWFMFRLKNEATSSTQTQAPAQELTGLSLGEAVRGYRFWLIFVAFVVMSFSISGLIPNLVPILKSMNVDNAAYYASLVGISIIFSRLATGYLVDHFWAPGVAMVLMLIAASACFLLSQGIAPAFAAVALGVAAGAEFDLIAFLCARYFGMKAYGRIYSWQWAGFALATAMGSVGFARMVDLGWGHGVVLSVAAAMVLIAGLMLLALGRYPNLEKASN